MQLAQLSDHDLAQFGVEGTERLVHQEAFRAADDGAAERHALAVAAGEPGDRAVEQVVDAQEFRGGLDLAADLGAGRALGDSGKAMFFRTFMCG